MAKQTNTIYYIVGAVVLGVAGIFGYKQYQAKKAAELEPQNEPTPTPNKQTTTKAKPATAAKIDQLQKLMIRRYIQLNRADEFTPADAKGGWGDKSRNALKYLQPTNYATKGDPNSANIEFWIQSITKDVEKAASEQQALKTKQVSTDQLKKLSKDIVATVNAGGTAKIIVPFVAVKHQFDNVKKTYIPLNETKNFAKDRTFGSGELVDRQNGQIMIVDGNYRYPTTPQNFLTTTY